MFKSLFVGLVAAAFVITLPYQGVSVIAAVVFPAVAWLHNEYKS